MALKMMSMSEVDKKFIDDNMLTDEDFQFDAEDEFEVSFEDQNILESFANNLKSLNSEIIPGSNSVPVDTTQDMITDFNDLFKDYVYDLDFKIEPPSPNSSVSSEVYSTDNEVSVITIPDTSNDSETTSVLTDTPPHTPRGVMDILPDSPLNCVGDPVIVSVSSGVSYAVPQNAQTVMNPRKYRVNIQPKIKVGTNGTKPVAIQTIIPKSGGHKSVLTPEQMEKLAKGTLQLRAPPNVAIPVTKVMQSVKAAPSSITRTARNGPKRNSTLNSLEMCAAALKRQERIIKNRESAYLSRKRKKEYVQKLEAELNQITAENSSLREENGHLKLKVSDLEKEILMLRTAFIPKNVKKTACFMIVLFMLTFNLTPYSSIFERAGPTSMKSGASFTNHRIGRTLLWHDGNSTEKKNDSKPVYRKLRHVPSELEATYIVELDNSYNSSSCQHFINKTESLRLENDLLGWVERVEKKRKQTKMKKQKFHMENTLPHLATWSKRRAELNKDIWARRKNKNEILIFETNRQAYADFFDAIHRRDDTFYFVSFSGDHLLLPAIAHNKTLRPRMSFVMPAMTLNESVGDSDDHISMMQIDCEVMDTKLVYIKESVIPEHLRQKQNNTARPHPRNASEYSSFRQTKRLQSVNRLPQKSRTNALVDKIFGDNLHCRLHISNCLPAVSLQSSPLDMMNP